MLWNLSTQEAMEMQAITFIFISKMRNNILIWAEKFTLIFKRLTEIQGPMEE